MDLYDCMEKCNIHACTNNLLHNSHMLNLFGRNRTYYINWMVWNKWRVSTNLFLFSPIMQSFQYKVARLHHFASMIQVENEPYNGMQKCNIPYMHLLLFLISPMMWEKERPYALAQTLCSFLTVKCYFFRPLLHASYGDVKHYNFLPSSISGTSGVAWIGTLEFWIMS